MMSSSGGGLIWCVRLLAFRVRRGGIAVGDHGSLDCGRLGLGREGRGRAAQQGKGNQGYIARTVFMALISFCLLGAHCFGEVGEAGKARVAFDALAIFSKSSNASNCSKFLRMRAM
jgi:hypothetical protein